LNERENEIEKKVKEYMDEVLEIRGYVYPYQEFWFRTDPEGARAEWEWYKQVRAKKWLPLKYKELIFLTSALIHKHPRGIPTHMKKALELGVTKEEILETIQVVSHTAGGGIPIIAVRILMEILGEPVPLEPKWKEKTLPLPRKG
jgi:alkylhydroperoxidase/carboxymuconolactone decarboxylase family protein YurZ